MSTHSVVKVDWRIRWHYTTTILRLCIGAWHTRYQNCKFHNGCRTISRHADGISRYSATLTCEMQNFCIWLKASSVLSNVGGSEKSQLWIVIGGSEKNWLLCVATGMAGKQHHNKCSQSDDLRHRYTLPVFFNSDELHHTPCSAEI